MWINQLQGNPEEHRKSPIEPDVTSGAYLCGAFFEIQIAYTSRRIHLDINNPCIINTFFYFRRFFLWYKLQNLLHCAESFNIIATTYDTITTTCIIWPCTCMRILIMNSRILSKVFCTRYEHHRYTYKWVFSKEIMKDKDILIFVNRVSEDSLCEQNKLVLYTVTLPVD